MSHASNKRSEAAIKKVNDICDMTESFVKKLPNNQKTISSDRLAGFTPQIYGA
jgi:hypothetical protein